MVPRVSQILREGKLGPLAWLRVARLSLGVGGGGEPAFAAVRRGYWRMVGLFAGGLALLFLPIFLHAPLAAALAALGAQLVHGALSLAFVRAHLGLVRDEQGQPMAQFGVANGLTVLRLVYLPSLVALLLLVPQVPALGGLTVVLYILLAGSDFLDGLFARRLGQISDFGRVYDPVCDILFNPSVVLALALAGGLPWWLAALVLLRYATAFFGGVAAYVFRGPFRVQPTLLGKLAALVLAVVVGLGLLDLCAQPSWLGDDALLVLFLTAGTFALVNTVYLVILGLRYRSEHGFEDAIY